MEELMVINSNGQIFWHGDDDVDAEIELENAEEKFPGEEWGIEPTDKEIDIKRLRAWSCFNEQEQSDFSERFYELWEAEGFGAPDYEATTPWGCPWDWYDGEIISADELFEAYKGEIKGYLNKENEED